MSFRISYSSQETDALATDRAGPIEKRENGPRCSARNNESLSESERRRYDHNSVASGNRREVQAHKQRRNCGTVSNGEHDTAPIFLSEEPSQAANHVMNGEDEPAACQQEDNEQPSNPMVDVSQEGKETFQQEHEGRVNELTDPVAVGTQPASDTSTEVKETNRAETSTITREEPQQLPQVRDDSSCTALNHPTCNGEEVLVSDSGVGGSVWSPYRQGRGAAAYWLRSPTQESGCHTFQRTQTLQRPTEQSAVPAVSQPDEDQGPLQCHQLCNSALVNAVSSMGATLQAVEHILNMEEFRLWKQKLDGQVLCIFYHHISENKERTHNAQKATRNKRNSGETFFIEILTQIAQLRQVDEDGVAPAIFSPAIYSDSFEYKVGIRLHPNGVDEEEGRYVSLFVHIMMGKYDDASEVRWPFTQRITVSILDQSDAKRHISHIIQPKPHLAAFQKPTEAITPTGYGFIKFAPIEEVFSSPYVENDKMFIKIQFSA